MKTASNKNFAIATHNQMPNSKIDRSKTHKTTMNASLLIPLYVDEYFPGDTVNLSVSALVRKLTPIVPTIDDESIKFFAFSVRCKSIWNGTKSFFGENQSTAWTNQANEVYPAGNHLVYSSDDHPEMDGVTESMIGAYMGLPTHWNGQTSFTLTHVTRLQVGGYCMIWNEFFRNQNVTAPLSINKDVCLFQQGSSIIDSNSQPFRVTKLADYFTSCLPSPQKGDAVSLPVQLQGLLPMVTQNAMTATGAPGLKLGNTGTAIADNSTLGVSAAAANDGGAVHAYTDTLSSGNAGGTINMTNLYADSSHATGTSVDINQLRYAIATQRIFEKDARGGTRYREVIKSHFGVSLNQLEDDIAEFLGEFSQPVHSTQQTNTDSNLGMVGASSTTATSGNLINKTFSEWGYVYVLACIRKKATYSQGIPRQFMRSERLDFYHPSLAHIGEQPVYVKELYAVPTDGSSSLDARLGVGDVFGYQEAWAEHRYSPNQISGQLSVGHSSHPLIPWTYQENYDAPPVLNDSWMQDNTLECVDKTIKLPSITYGNTTVQHSHQYLVDTYISSIWTRTMPVHSIPGLMDHF